MVFATLPTGGVERFTKNADASYTASDSRSKLVKNADNTYTLTTKDQYSYGFDVNGWLCWMKDKNGNTITITVDASGKISKITDPAGRQFIVAYNSSNGLIDTVTDQSLGRTVHYGYNANNLLNKVTDPMGKTMNYDYDTDGFLKQISNDSNKVIETIVYDHTEGTNQHKVKQATDAQGDTSVFTYDPLNWKTTVSENNGAKMWTYWFDYSMYTTKVQDPDGRYTTTLYYNESGKNKYGDVQSETDRNGNTTVYTRDGMGNVTTITNPDTSSKSYGYDSKNNLLWEKDELGKYKFYTYDANNNLCKKVQPLNGTDQYTGVDGPNFAITTNIYYTDSEAQTLGYKAKGLLKTVTDPEGNTTTYTYDSNGNVATNGNKRFEKDGKGVPRETVFDELI